MLFVRIFSCIFSFNSKPSAYREIVTFYSRFTVFSMCITNKKGGNYVYATVFSK